MPVIKGAQKRTTVSYDHAKAKITAVLCNNGAIAKPSTTNLPNAHEKLQSPGQLQGSGQLFPRWGVSLRGTTSSLVDRKVQVCIDDGL